MIAAIGPAGSDHLHAAWGRHLETLWLKREAELRAAWSQATARLGEAAVKDAYALGRSLGIREGHPMGYHVNLAEVAEDKADALATGVAALREGEAPR